MKKLLIVLCVALPLLAGCTANNSTAAAPAPQVIEVSSQKPLPPPVDSTKPDASKTPFVAAVSSISVANLYEYFGRDDVFYIDLRDFADYQKKHLRNFECIPYFAYIFNAEAHTDPSKVQLYGGTVDAPVAAYEESDELLEVLFPKDKTLFLMCQSGGRVAQCMTLLNAKGYDMSKIYNVGGMGQYTANEYKPYVVDAAEFGVNATYSLNDVTRAK